MESIDEELELSSEEYNTNSNKWKICIIISSVGDILFINSTQNSIKNIESNEESKFNNHEPNNEIESIIIDIPKPIKNKDAKSIKMLSLQSITPDIDAGTIICNEEQKDSINANRIDSKILAESDVTFEFLERTKHQKLSTLQIEYLKNQICESGLT